MESSPAPQPREKLLKQGAHALSDSELLAVLLGCGTRGRHVSQISEVVLEVFNSPREGDLSIALRNIKGIGSAKAAQLEAAVEFSRRRIAPRGYRVKSPSDVAPLVGFISHAKQEHLVCLTLNGANEVIATRVVTIGLANMCHLHPREVFSDAITDRACSIILAHNHPSGELSPSPQDISITERIKQAGELLGIGLLDHIIVSINGHRSILRK
jgi:DNA repair protein RadC